MESDLNHNQITNQPIRVLQAIVIISAGGGAESLLMNIYRNIDRNRVQFDFLTSIKGNFEEEIRELGGHVYRIPYLQHVGPLIYRHNLASFFRKHKEYRIIHAHMDKMNGMVLNEAKKAGIPVRIAHSHSTASGGRWLKRTVKQYYSRHLRSAPTDCIACSADAGRWLFPDAFDRVRVMQNGIVFDDWRFSETERDKKRVALGLAKDDRMLFHVGRFDKAKNQKFALDVFARLVQRGEKYRFLLAGTGALLNDMKAYAVEKGIADKTEFLGHRDDIPALMMAADALVFPSIYEGLSIVLIEAQASGLPCVITDTLATESIARPELVTRLPLGDAGVWAAAVRKILDDRVGAVRISFIPPEYDIKNIAAELEAFYVSRYVEVEGKRDGSLT
jgi:glycosyltransferase involved in cell wall biosynthesis